MRYFGVREAGAAPAAEAGEKDLVDDRRRGHLRQGLGHGLVAVEGDVFLDLLGVDPAAVAQDDQPLVLEELDVLHLRDRLLLGRRDVHQLLDRTALEEVLLDEVRDIFHCKELVEDAVRLDHDDRPPLAEAVAARGHDLDLVLELPLFDLVLEGRLDLEGPAGDAARAGTDQ